MGNVKKRCFVSPGGGVLTGPACGNKELLIALYFNHEDRTTGDVTRSLCLMKMLLMLPSVIHDMFKNDSNSALKHRMEAGGTEIIFIRTYHEASGLVIISALRL